MENQTGRSMIEMLGVLAIVGILSIGGISAFQKAMTKHKINQTTEEFSQFINDILGYSAQIKRLHKNDETAQLINISSSIEFLKPIKWIKRGPYFYDSMGNRINPFLRNDGGDVKIKKFALDYEMKIGKDNIELCMAMFNMAKPYYEELSGISVWTKTESVGASGSRTCGTDGRKCLSDVTLTDIKKFCDTCTSKKEVCTLAIGFNL
ncbi:MAG: type II secretion system protein [Alphaproteobacteria bacterium]|nr:type II secretion system protein [Alphaproteobacteria bacterium]